MRLVRGALGNPYAVIVMALAIIVIGITVLTRIPVDILPIFKTPAVQIVTFYPGMPAEIMERDITTRLERWTGQSVGIARQESKSMIGVSIVKDYFRPDIDPNTAMSQVTSYAMSDLFYLPPGTIPPMVMPFDPTATIPLAILSVSSPTYDETKLYDIAYFDLRNRLQGISGVIAPAVYGGKLRRILAYVDPGKLEARGLSPMDVVQTLRSFSTPPDMTGKRQVYIPIYRQPGANTIAVVDGIRAALSSILERLPPGINLGVVMDQSV